MLTQFTFNGLVTGSLYAVLGVSFALILSMTGRLHVAYVATFVTAPYIGIWLMRNLNMPAAIGIIGGLLAATGFGMLIEFFVYRRLARRSLARRADPLIPVFIASLGITIAVQNAIQLFYGPLALTFDVYDIEPVRLGSVRTTNLNITVMILCWLMVGGLAAFLRYSRLGKQMRAVRENPLLAEVVGIRPDRIRLLVFAIASLMSGILGQVSALQAGVQPFMGFDQIFSAFVVAFLAGATRSPLAIGFVGLLVGQVVNGLGGRWYGGEYAPLVLFSILLVFVAAKSAGETRAGLYLRDLRRLVPLRATG